MSFRAQGLKMFYLQERKTIGEFKNKKEAIQLKKTLSNMVLMELRG